MSSRRRFSVPYLLIALLCAGVFAGVPLAYAASGTAWEQKPASGDTPYSQFSMTLEQLISPVYSTLGNALSAWLPGTRMLFGSSLHSLSLDDQLPLHDVLSRIAIGSFKLKSTTPGVENLNQPELPVQDRYRHEDPQYQPFVGLRYLFRFDGPPDASQAHGWGVNLSVDTQYH